jgi:RimJ/RimL family protein N-acetyltransferase
MVDARALCTARLLLPPLERSHTQALAMVYSDPDVARYIGGQRLTAESIPVQVSAFADEWEERGYGQSAAILRETGQFIGRIGLHYWPEWDEVELGYILARSAQGRGLATEGARAWLEIAAAIPDLDYVIANIHPENHPSTRLAEKLGFAFSRHDTTPSGQPTLIYRLDF